MSVSAVMSCGGPSNEVLPDVRAVVVTNFIIPHVLPVYEALRERLGGLTLLISTPMESNRSWTPNWGKLDVRIQRAWTLKRRFRHPVGFTDAAEIHVPWDTIRQLKRLRPDVVVSTELGFRSLLSAVYTRRRGGPALVLMTQLSEHTERARGWLRHRLRKWLLRQADAIAVNGSSGKRYLEGMGCDPRRIVRVPYTPAPDAIPDSAAPRGPDAAHKLLYVGQLIERKGVRPFLEALSAWAAARPQQPVELALAGSGPLQADLEAIRPPANLTLRWLGLCSFDQIRQCYADSGILAFPTLADEWGLVVNEAMGAGLPVLGSRYSQAVEELCVDGETGWTFRPDSPAEIHRALDRAFACTPEELNVMRVKARQRVAGITPEFAAGRTIEAIRLALENRRRSNLG